MVTPCKDCTKRNASCHSSCKDYLGWKDEINKYNEQRRKEKNSRANNTRLQTQS